MIRRPGLLRGAVAVTVVVVLAGACAAASPSPSPSPTAISAQTADAIAIGEVGSPGTVKVISTVLSTYGAESQGGAIVADGTTVWAVRLAGTFQPPSCGPYSATPDPCPSPATTALVLLDATTGAVIEETMPAPGASSPVATTSSSTTGPATAIIPWTAATPAPQPSLTAMVIPTGTPPCRARDLTGTAGWTGGGGAMLGGIGLTNVGAAPCVIDGPPKQLQLRSADALLDVAYSAVDQPTPGSRLTSVTPVLMRPEDEADADLIWSNWCAEMIPVVTAVLVTLPDFPPLSPTGCL